MSIKEFINALRGPRYELIDLAIERTARLRGELEGARYVCEQYAERLMDLNPHDNWWLFAHLKQKHVDACEDCATLSAMYARASTELAALESAQ